MTEYNFIRQDTNGMKIEKRGMGNEIYFYLVWHCGSVIKQYGSEAQAVAYINTF